MSSLADIIVPEGLNLKKIITVTIEGVLDEDDLLALAGGDLAAPHTDSPAAPAPHVEPEDPSDLKKLREKHHAVARNLAAGLSQRMVASICGYTESYLSVLLNSPAMQELVELYRAQQGRAAEVISEKLRTVGLQALEQAADKINEMNNSELIQLAKLGLDRSGHGPSSTQHVVSETHLFDHTELAALNAQARQGSRSYTLPIADERKALLPAPQDITEGEYEALPAITDGDAGDDS